MREIIVTYNAEQLGYTKGGLENTLDLFEHEPKPESALYIANKRFGTELGSIIATYTTDDPETLVGELKEHYGAAISYVEEGGMMHTLGAEHEEAQEDEKSKDER